MSKPDLRPAIIFDNVADATVNGLSVKGTVLAESLLRFTNTRDVLLAAPRVLTPASVFLGLEGVTNDGITIDGGDFQKWTDL